MGQLQKRVEPDEFRRQSRLVGFMGLAGDIVVASVFIALQPFEDFANYVLAIVLVGTGLVLMYVFAIRLPRNYEKNYQRLNEPK